MKYTFEIFISGDSVTKENWQKFYKALNSYGGIVGKFRLIFEVKDKIVRFYIQCDKDLGAISNNIEGMVLREIDEADLNIPQATTKERFFNFVTGGNFLDTKEKFSVKTGKELQTVVMDMRAINENNAYIKAKIFLKRVDGTYSVANKTATKFPVHLLAVDFGGDNATYLKKKIDKYLDIEKSLHLFSSDDNQALFQVEGFPYLRGDYFLNLYNYDFYKHSFIVGASGSGKSKLISLIVDRIASSQFKDQYNVVVVDPHNALKDEFLHIEDSNIVGFGNESVELFNDSPKDIQAEAELTTMLFKSLMGDQFNPRLERVLKYSLFVLFTAKSMNLDQLKRFLIESDLRNQMVEHVSGYVPDNVTRFFGADYNEIKSQHYNEAILPIISLVDEMALQPGMTTEGQASIGGMVREKFLTVFSLNKVSMGEKVVKTVAGLIIQQLFLLAQAGSFGGKKVILIVDEVSIVQNPALAQILAEARKFGLTVVLTQQYFGQIEKDLQDAIFANTYNYYVFKVSEEDARALEGNLSIELPKSLVETESKGRLNESDIRVKILTELSPRECLVRLSENDKIHPCIKAKTVTAEFIKSNAVKAEDLKTFEQVKLPDKFVESSGDSFKSLDVTPFDSIEQPSQEEVANPFSSKGSEDDLAQPASIDVDSAKMPMPSPNIDEDQALAGSTENDDATVDFSQLEQAASMAANSSVKNESTPSQVAYSGGGGGGSGIDEEEEFINISMLLAEQSSSRKVVNEYNKGDK